MNVSIHAGPILRCTRAARVTIGAGFHDMAKATGRLLGMRLSKFADGRRGLPLCLATAAAIVTQSWRAASRLRTDGEGARAA